MMLTKASALVRSIPRISHVNVTRAMGYAAPAHFKTVRENDTINKTTMDFMPVPQGSWQEHNSKKQAKYHLMIAGSSAFLGATIFALWKFNCFYFHDQPDYKSIKIDNY